MRYLAFILLFAVTAAQAETRYVSDELVINLRTGQGNSYQILQLLKAGTALEVLEVNDQYTRVRTPRGLEGWVLSQYLLDQPAARDRLVAAEQKLSQFGAENQRLKQQIAALQGERTELKKSGSQLEKTNQNVQQELEKLREISANPLKLSNENLEMKERIASLESETARLTDLNRVLRDDSFKMWFLTGAGVLGGGILLGLILPKLRRRKSGWGSDL